MLWLKKNDEASSVAEWEEIVDMKVLESSRLMSTTVVLSAGTVSIEGRRLTDVQQLHDFLGPGFLKLHSRHVLV